MYAAIKTMNKKNADDKSGLIIFDIDVFNQYEEEVQKGEWMILLAKRITAD